VDTVAWVNYQSGTKLSIVSKLYDVTDKKYVELTNATGSDKTVIVTNVTSTGVAKQTKNVTFQFDSSALAGHTLTAVTAFNAELNGKPCQPVIHNEDYTDPDETIQYVSITSDLVENANKTHILMPVAPNTLTETLTYKVPAGVSARAVVTLRNVTTKKDVETKNVTLDATKTSVATTFSPIAAKPGEIFSAKAELQILDGSTWKSITTHNDDYTVAAETVYTPLVATEIATKTIGLGDVKVEDSVSVTNVPVGATVELVARLYDKKITKKDSIKRILFRLRVHHDERNDGRARFF